MNWEKLNLTYVIKSIIRKFVKKSWRYNMTDTQRWWASIVEKDMKDKNLEIDDDGHTRRIGDGQI